MCLCLYYRKDHLVEILSSSKKGGIISFNIRTKVISVMSFKLSRFMENIAIFAGLGGLWV